MEEAVSRHARGGSETSTLKCSDAARRLLLKKTERQILGQFFVTPTAFREGGDAKPGAKYRLAAQGHRRPGKPNARLPIADPEVVVIERSGPELGSPGHARRSGNRPGVEPEVDHLVV